MEFDGAYYLILESEALEKHLEIIAEIDKTLNHYNLVGGTKL